MRAMADGRIVLDLIVVVIHIVDAQRISARSKCIQNADGGRIGKGIPVIAGALVFKARFIHGFAAQHLRITESGQYVRSGWN